MSEWGLGAEKRNRLNKASALQAEGLEK